MDLNSLIPDISSDSSWSIKGRFLMFRKYENIPTCYIDDNVVYVFLDNRIKNPIIKLVKHLMRINCEFYFTSPIFSHPSYKGLELDRDKIINHYLFSYVQYGFFKGFNKIEFDLIKNLVDWCIKEDCVDLIRPIYDELDHKINSFYYDWYTNQRVYEYSEEIRNDYKTLYREIQINIIGI
jgi:hypothetical protein